jgi:hypothetical protein
METQHQELLSLVQREFTDSFHREQSLGESHCPSVFALELERLPDILPSLVEGWWKDATDRPEPGRLSESGGWRIGRPQKRWSAPRSQEISPQGRRE